MWFAVTARSLNLKHRERIKEFFSGDIQVIFTGNSKADLEEKLIETKKRYPVEIKKYLKAGIKFVEAENIIQAKRKAQQTNIYFDDKGQYHIF